MPESTETGSVRKRRKTDVGFITSSCSNRFVQPRQMLRALFYLPRQTHDSCSVMKKKAGAGFVTSSCSVSTATCL